MKVRDYRFVSVKKDDKIWDERLFWRLSKTIQGNTAKDNTNKGTALQRPEVAKGFTTRGVTFDWCGFFSAYFEFCLASFLDKIQIEQKLHQPKVMPLDVKPLMNY